MEAAAARQELHVVHRFRTGRFAGGQPQRWTNRHEQQGPFQGPITRIFIIRLTLIFFL